MLGASRRSASPDAHVRRRSVAPPPRHAHGSRARGGQAGSRDRGLLAGRYSACSGRAPPPPDTRRQVVCGARPLSLSTAGRPARQHRRGLGAPAPAQRTPRARCRAAPESAGSSPPSSMRRAAGESHLSCKRGLSKVSSTPGQISRCCSRPRRHAAGPRPQLRLAAPTATTGCPAIEDHGAAVAQCHREFAGRDSCAPRASRPRAAHPLACVCARAASRSPRWIMPPWAAAPTGASGAPAGEARVRPQAAESSPPPAGGGRRVAVFLQKRNPLFSDT